MDDFLLRVQPSTKERRLLAQSGAINTLEDVRHRRDAQWQVELPLHDDLFNHQTERTEALPAMSVPERLTADFLTQQASVGPHPMRLWRRKYGNRNILSASQLHSLPHGVPVTVAGMVICRQRPGTAKGHCFISLEDESGISNLFVKRETFEQLHQIITSEPFLRVEGRLQRSEGDQPTVYVLHLEPLENTHPEQAAASYDFH